MIVNMHTPQTNTRSIDQKISEIATARTNKALESISTDLERLQTRMRMIRKNHREELLDSPDLDLLLSRQANDLADLIQKIGKLIQ